MTRFFKVLSLIGMSSVLLSAGACQMAGHGFSLLPNIPLSIGNLLGLGT